ncbi:MAG: SusC/RagA family TonB-linked outer membrane protein [Candidatus Cryptobacteroides sp.]
MKTQVFIHRLIYAALFLSLLFVPVCAGAQNSDLNIKGKITDSKGEPLMGVAVVVQDENRGEVSDIDGNYSIARNVTKDRTILSFMCLGFKTLTIEVPDSQVVADIVLEEDANLLDEAVAIGYGTQTKRTITAAVTSISEKDLSGYAGSSIEQTIAGLVPGVRIMTADATPGGDTNIEVRGVGTITSGSEPLYIVDGIPMEGGLSSLNPDDVKSIQILKDAASTAVYGARGANGVFLITTKRGSEGKVTVNFNAAFTLAKAQRKFQVLNAAELEEYFADYGISSRYRYLTNATQDFFPYDVNNDTDWQDAIFQLAFQQKYNISLSGGNKNLKYRVSGEIYDQPGTVVYTGMQRYAFRSNFDFTLAKWANMSLNFSTTYSKTRKTKDGGNGSNGVIRTAIEMCPFYPVYLPDGSFFSNCEYNMAATDDAIVNGPDPLTGKYESLRNSPLNTENDNPVKIARDYKNITDLLRTTGAINFEFKLAKGLAFKPSFSIDAFMRNNNIWYPASIGNNRTDSSASSRSKNQIMWINEDILSFERSFGMHNLSLMAGCTFQSTTYKELYAGAYKFESESLPSINGGTVNAGTYDKVTDRLNSYMARVGYNYKQKYMIQAVFRADGSSRFGANHKFGYFPSVSAGWAMSEEKWMQKQKVISELKIRGSWGLSGNNAIGQFNYLNKMGKNSYVIDGQVISGWASNNIANPDLKWEQSDQLNVGLDLGFAKNRVFLQLDFYRSVTKDMLLNTQVPSTLGVSTMLQNVGSVLNRGVEFNIVSRNITGKFNWTTTFNISANRNKVLGLGIDSEAIYAGVEESNITLVGYPMGMFYGRVFGGIYQSLEEIEALRNDPYSGLAFDENVRPGDLKFYDLNGDGVYNDDDRTIIGNPYPKFNAGMVNTFSYKNFTLSIQLVGQYGNQIYNTSLMQLLKGSGSNASVFVKDRWRSPEEPGNGLVGRSTTTNDVKPSAEEKKFTNRLLEDGSYLNIRNIQLSYNFGKKVLKKLRLQGLNLNFNIDNLYTFTKYTGLNPESNSMMSAVAPGVDQVGYPVSRNFTFGLKLSF